MGYDEGLASRVRELLRGEPDLVEQRLFGGLGFLLGGNLAVGVRGDDLIVRSDPATYQDDLVIRGVRPFDLSGRPMKGWLLVDASGQGDDEALRGWVERGASYARTLPRK